MLQSNNLIGFGAGDSAPAASGNDANTLLLLHFDGTNGSTTFTDSSSYARTATVVGNAQLSTAWSKFGTASALFDGSGDVITFPDSADWNFGANNFTIDFWMKSSTSSPICGQSYFTSGSDFQYGVHIQGSGGALVVAGGSGPQNASLNFTSSSSTYFDGSAHHVALVRNGNVFTIYKDGVADGSQTISITLMNSSETFKIGRSNTASGDYNGSIDEFRISNIARWTTGFTPPTSAYGP